MLARIHPRTRLKLQWLLAAILCLPFVLWWLLGAPQRQLEPSTGLWMTAYRLADGTSTCLVNADRETTNQMMESSNLLAWGLFQSNCQDRSNWIPAIVRQTESATVYPYPSDPTNRQAGIDAILPHIPNANIRAALANDASGGQMLDASDQFNRLSLAGIRAMLIPLSLLSGILLFLFTRYQQTVLRDRNEAGQCLGCGYPLPDVRRPCPECGRAFMANKIAPR